MEPPTLEHAAEQWVRWTWNVSQALFERATQPGRSAEVAIEDVSRALAAPMKELMNGVQASPPEAQKVVAFGRGGAVPCGGHPDARPRSGHTRSDLGQKPAQWPFRAALEQP